VLIREPPNMLPESKTRSEQKVALLRDRACMLGKVRAFFAERHILEVDCPILSDSASIDLHIDLLACDIAGGQRRYLHSSPEYGMKRLLALGIGDVYQLSHVFRDDEVGAYHNPEFMMAEWYRVGFSLEDLVGETCDFMALFLGQLPCEELSYEEAFLRYLQLNPFEVGRQELAQLVEKMALVSFDPHEQEMDDLLSLLLSHCIQPHLGSQGLTALSFFPPSQAALAQVRLRGQHRVAERFEVFYKGLELANGYHELIDPVEQRKRLGEANRDRLLRQKSALPIDERFLKALESGLPDAAGVAVGFDRLMMLRHQAASITEVIAWDWSMA
jgi:lysyl-tRNA synthetase class 2